MIQSADRPSAGLCSPVVEDIGPRILFSGDAEALLALPDAASANTVFAVQPTTEQANSDQYIPVASLVVIDGTMPDTPAVLSELEGRRAQGEAIEYLVLDPQIDGIDAISQHLQNTRTLYSEVHILTHGDIGQFELGSETVDADLLRSRSADFAQWSEHLTTDADLLIYGCDLSADESGKWLANTLAILTTADVATSDNITGSSLNSGDWVLESSTGAVEAPLPISDDLAQHWVGTLEIDPTGTEQTVNQTTAGKQEFKNNHDGRQIATNGSSVVVVWEDSGTKDIYFRLFNQDGTAQGGEQMITNTGNFDREEAAVAMQSNGNFIIVWTSKNQDGDTDGIYAQRFDSAGAPLARPTDAYSGTYSNAYEFRVNQVTAKEQRRAAVATRDDGTFVVAWESNNASYNAYRATYQAFNADATRINPGDQIALTDSNSIDQTRIALAAKSNGGNAILAFVREDSDTDIQLREIKADGTLGVIKIISSAGEDLANPQIAMNASGAYAVALENPTGNGTIDVWRYDSAGNNLDGGLAIIANQISAGNQLLPSLVLADSGRIVVTWQDSQISGAGKDIVAQEISASGVRVGSAFVMNTTTAGNQESPDIALAGSTALVIWDKKGPTDNDGITLTTAQLDLAQVLYTTSGTSTSENGSFVDVDFVLSRQPASAVTVTVSTSDSGEGAPDITTLTFTTANWNTLQSVRITGQDDLLVDGDVPYMINYSVVSAGDPDYNSLPIDSISLTNLDDEVPNLSSVSAISDTDAAANEILENAVPTTPVGLTVFADDPDVPDTVGYSLSSNPGGLFAIDPVSGVITLNAGASLDRESASTHQITVRATSTDSSFSEQVFVLAVLDVNDNAPQISGAGFSLAENSANSTPVGTPSVADPDIVGNLQNWTIVGGSGATAFSIDTASGEIRVADQNQLDHETNSTLTLDLTVSDGVNTSAVQSISLAIGDQEEAPIGGDTTITTTEDTDYTFLIGDFAFSDIDVGDQLAEVVIETLPSSGGLELLGVPVSVSQSVSRADIVAGSLVYLPAPNASGSPASSFTVTVYDSGGLPAATPNTITVNITEVNDPPDITSNGGGASAAINVPENSSAVTTVMATDVDLPAQTLTYAIVPVGSGGGADAARFSIDPNSGALTFSTVPDFEAPSDAGANNVYDVTVRVSDGNGQATDQVIAVTVTDQNEAPSGSDKTIVTNEDVAYVFTVADFGFSDPDIGISLSGVRIDTLPGAGGLTLSGSPVSAPQVISVVDINAGNLLFTPLGNANGVGYANFVFSVLDVGGLFSSAPNTLTINVTPVDDVPILTANTGATLVEDGSVIISNTMLSIGDIDSPPANRLYTMTTAPTTGSLRLTTTPLTSGQTFTQDDVDNGRVDYLHNGAEVFADTFQFTYEDDVSGPLGGPEVFGLTISPFNDNIPVFTSNGGGSTAALSMAENSTSVTTVMATDADLPTQTITYSITGGADMARFSIGATTGVLTFTTPPDFEAPTDVGVNSVYEVTVQADDGNGASVSQAISVTVVNQTEALSLAMPAAVVTAEDVALTLSGATGLSIADADNAPTLDFSISVDKGTITLAQTTGLTFSAGDGVADQTMSFSGSRAALNGAIGTLLYTPAPDDHGVASVAVTLSDPSNLTRLVSQPMIVSITAVNDSPVVGGSRAVGVTPGVSTTLDRSVIEATDVEDNPANLVYTLTTAPQFGVLRLNGVALLAGMTFTQGDIESGAVSFDGLPVTESADGMTLSVSDSDGSAISGIQISITALSGGYAPPTDAGAVQSPASSATQGAARERTSEDSNSEAQESPTSSSAAASAIPNTSSDSEKPGPSTGRSGSAQADATAVRSPASGAKKDRDAFGGRRFIEQGSVFYDDARKTDSNRSIDLSSSTEKTRLNARLRVAGDFQSTQLNKAIDNLRDDLSNNLVLDRRVVASTVAVSASFSIGYVLWLIRGGALLSSLLASMPAWWSIDPLPVLSNLPSNKRKDADDESLQEMLNKPKRVDDQVSVPAHHGEDVRIL